MQKEIIEILESEPRLTQGKVQIIACAGSGKTEFISTRIAYMIYKGIAKPENVVAFTFTERAAEELKLRIRSLIRELIGHQPDIGDLYVGTIHSFCFELLKEFVPGYRGYDVLDEGKRYAFIYSISSELGEDKLERWLEASGIKKPYNITKQAWVIGTLIRGIDIVREEMQCVEDISACSYFCEALREYDEKLKQRKFLDFSSMMAHTLNVIKNDKSILREVRNRFTHITVDEYQDVNPIQEQIIELLCGKKGNLCVVGDDDQSIYQWRGTTVENIITFKKRYKNVYTHNLPTNFRSSDGIVNLSRHLIVKNKHRLRNKKIKSAGNPCEPGDIYKIKFYYQEQETQFITNRIKSLIGTQWVEKDGHKRGLTYSDIAVFFRSVRYDGRPYLDAFDNAGIPYAVSGIGGLFDTPEVDIVFSIFSFLGDFGKIRDTYTGSYVIPDEDSIYRDAKIIFPLPQKRTFKRSLCRLRDELRGKRRISLQELYADILVLLGLASKEMHGGGNEVKMYNLGRFSQVISDYEGTRTYCTTRDIQGICWFVKHYAENSYDSGTGEDPTLAINAVQVMTLHGTKGLGFPVVFMPYCVDRAPRETPPGFLDVNKFNFSRYRGSVEDERRLFYVGMTRSKKFLYVSTSYDPGYRKWKKTPSRFFNELDNQCCITEDKSDPTKRKKMNPNPSVETYRFPTNYSELSDYIRCEYDYKLRYIYGFNPVIVQALGYGKQVHNVLNILHKRVQQTGEIPHAKEIAKVVTDHFNLRYAAEEQEETLRKSALRSVLRYVDMWEKDFTLSVKTERSFEMDVENALLSGSIDLLKREDSREDILEIIDFKTGNERKMDEELNLQVQLYAVAAREALALNVKKAFVHFLDSKKQERVEVSTTSRQLESAMNTIKNAIKGVTSRRFRRNPRNSKTCSACDWRKICPKKIKHHQL
jgi:DNA helicase-2/ATP-dependent DNA helicase PcrA